MERGRLDHFHYVWLCTQWEQFSVCLWPNSRLGCTSLLLVRRCRTGADLYLFCLRYVCGWKRLSEHGIEAALHWQQRKRPVQGHQECQRQERRMDRVDGQLFHSRERHKHHFICGNAGSKHRPVLLHWWYYSQRGKSGCFLWNRIQQWFWWWHGTGLDGQRLCNRQRCEHCQPQRGLQLIHQRKNTALERCMHQQIRYAAKRQILFSGLLCHVQRRQVVKPAEIFHQPAIWLERQGKLLYHCHRNSKQGRMDVCRQRIDNSGGCCKLCSLYSDGLRSHGSRTRPDGFLCWRLHRKAAARPCDSGRFDPVERCLCRWI